MKMEKLDNILKILGKKNTAQLNSWLQPLTHKHKKTRKQKIKLWDVIARVVVLAKSKKQLTRQTFVVVSYILVDQLKHRWRRGGLQREASVCASASCCQASRNFNGKQTLVYLLFVSIVLT